jgi:hypothetical protein
LVELLQHTAVVEVGAFTFSVFQTTIIPVGALFSENDTALRRRLGWKRGISTLSVFVGAGIVLYSTKEIKEARNIMTLVYDFLLASSVVWLATHANVALKRATKESDMSLWMTNARASMVSLFLAVTLTVFLAASKGAVELFHSFTSGFKWTLDGSADVNDAVIWTSGLFSGFTWSIYRNVLFSAAADISVTFLSKHLTNIDRCFATMMRIILEGLWDWVPLSITVSTTT